MRILTLLILSSLSFPLLAQLDLGTHFIRGTWQAYQSNPALLPQNRITIALPSLYGYGEVSGFTLNEVLEENSQGQTLLNVDKAISLLEPQNYIRDRVDLGTLGVGFHAGDWYLSLGHSIRQNAYSKYPKELAQLAWKGNAQFIGQEIQIAPRIGIQAYQEVSLGLGFQASDNFTLGARIKLLNGVGNISSRNHDLRLFTSDDIYQLTVNGDYGLNTAGTQLRYNGFSDIDVDLDLATFNWSNTWTNNTGFALDVGASLRLGKLELAASILDLGQINWKEDATSLAIKGEYTFEGLDIFPNVWSDSVSFNNIVDTLEARFKVTQTDQSYATILPTYSFFSANLHISDKTAVGILAYGERISGEWLPAMALSAQTELLKGFNLGAAYVIRNKRFDNLGVNASLRIGPLQVLAATDNLLTLLQSSKSNTVNGRVGVNLIFGQMDKEAQKKMPDEKDFFK